MNGSASQYLEHFDCGYDEHVADEQQEQEYEAKAETNGEEYDDKSSEEIVSSSPAITTTAIETETVVTSTPAPAPASASASVMNEMDDLSSSFVLVDHNGDDVDVQQVKEQDDIKYQQQWEQEREQERENEDQVFKGPKIITLADFMFERPAPAPKVSRRSQHRSPALVGRVSSTPPATSTSLFQDETIPTHIDGLKPEQNNNTNDKPSTSTSTRSNIFTLMRDGGGQSKLVTQINQDEIEPSAHFRTSSSLDVWLLICFFLRPIDVCRLTSTCDAMRQTLLSRSSRYWRRLFDLRYGISTKAIATLPEAVQPVSGQHWLRQYAFRVVYNRKCRRGEGYIPLNLATIPTSYPPLIKQPTAQPPRYIDTSNDGWMVSFHPGHVSSLHFYDTRYRPTPWSGGMRPSHIPLDASILRTIQSDAMVHVVNEGSHYVHAPFITHQIHHMYPAIDAIVDWKEEMVVIMSKQYLEIFQHATKPRPGPEAVKAIEAPDECTFVSIRWVQLVRPVVTSTTTADTDATAETIAESIPVATDDKTEIKLQLTLIVCISNGDVCVYTPYGVLLHTYVSTLHQVMSPSTSASTSNKKPSYIFHVSETTVIRAYHTYVDVIRLDRQRVSQPFRNSTSSAVTSIHACQHGVITVHTSGAVILRTNGGLKQIIRDAPDTTMSNSVQVSTINHELRMLVLFQAEPQINNRALGGHLLFYTFDIPDTTPTSAPTSTSTSTSPFRLFHTISTPPLIFQGTPRVDIDHDQILIHLIPSTTIPISFGTSIGTVSTPCIISSDINLTSPRLSLISYLWTDLQTSILVAADVHCYHINNRHLIVAEGNGLIVKSRLLGGGENYSSIHTSIRVSSPRVINSSSDFWYDPVLQRKKPDEQRNQQVQTNVAALEYERRLRIQQQQDRAYQQRIKERAMDRAAEERRARQQAQERRGGRDRKKDPFMG